MNLNPGTSRDIYSFISDLNNDEVSCNYCIEGNCYTTCRIYAPETPGIHKINITLNDSKNISYQTLTVFVPGEVPTSNSNDKTIKEPKSNSGSAIQSIVEENPESPYSDEKMAKTETTEDNSTTPRNETPSNEELNVDNDCASKNEATLTIKDIIYTIIILGLLGIIMSIMEKNHKKEREERHKEMSSYNEMFSEK